MGVFPCLLGLRALLQHLAACDHWTHVLMKVRLLWGTESIGMAHACFLIVGGRSERGPAGRRSLFPGTLDARRSGDASKVRPAAAISLIARSQSVLCGELVVLIKADRLALKPHHPSRDIGSHKPSGRGREIVAGENPLWERSHGAHHVDCVVRRVVLQNALI